MKRNVRNGTRAHNRRSLMWVSNVSASSVTNVKHMHSVARSASSDVSTRKAIFPTNFSKELGGGSGAAGIYIRNATPDAFYRLVII